jgi:hypothetical protein
MRLQAHVDDLHAALAGHGEHVVQMVSDECEKTIDAKLHRGINEEFCASRHLCHTKTFDA